MESAIPTQAMPLATGERALSTLREWGRVVLVDDMGGALEAADAIAPEHLSLQCRDAETLAERVRNAGAIFIGPWSAVAAGDYATGTNHVLPTGGSARAYGGVGVESFGRWLEVQRVTPAGVRPGTDGRGHRRGRGAAGTRRLRDAAGRARDGDADAVDDPVELLRRPAPVDAYPSEPSDEEVAASLGLPVNRCCAST